MIATFGKSDRLLTPQAKPITRLWAIPRCQGINDALARKANPTLDLADGGIKSTIGNAARASGSARVLWIPPQLLEVIGWVESVGEVSKASKKLKRTDPTYPAETRFSGLGWNQWGYIRPINEAGLAYDKKGTESTVVTWDGGIGMFQITQGTVLDTAPGHTSAAILTHLYNFSSQR